MRIPETLRGLKKDLNYLKNLYWPLIIKKKIRNYFKNNIVAKLHIGSNISLLSGWLCSDIKPQNKSSIFLDATKKFPFEKETFDYVYSEHMIEHITQQDGIFMIDECYRILKNGGKIRLSTPDIEKIIKIYIDKKSNFGNVYAKWISDNFLGKEDNIECLPLIVVNTLFRNWYHVFLYDEELLTKSLQNAGFKNIKRYAVGKSEDNNLVGIEQHHLNVGNLEMVEFESLILEAEK